MAQTTAERQRAYRARLRDQGLTSTFSANCSDQERFYLERLLLAMRETGGIPAALRDPKTGRYMHLDA